jgi:hypothetical protein
MAFRATRRLNSLWSGKSHDIVKQTSETITTYDKYRMSRFPKFPVFRAFSGIVCVSGVGFVLYTLFKKPLHKYFSSEGSAVAVGIVNSPEVRHSVKTGVGNIIDDKELSDKLKTFIKDNLEQITKEKWFTELLSGTGTQLVKELTNDVAVKDSLAEMFIILFDRQDIKDGLAEMFIGIFTRQDIIDGLNKLIIDACKDPTNKEEISTTLKEIMTKKEMQDELGKLLRGVVLKALFG